MDTQKDRMAHTIMEQDEAIDKAQAEIARLTAERDAAFAAGVEAAADLLPMCGACGGSEAIRALATTDQRAALDKMVAERVAEALVNQFQNGMSCSPADAELAKRGEPEAWRWRPKGSTVWLYDPDQEWLAKQSRDEIDAEPVYAHPAPASAGVTVKPLKLGEVLKLWRQHGGDTHGPRIETWTIPEARVMGFIAALSPTAEQGGLITPIR